MPAALQRVNVKPLRTLKCRRTMQPPTTTMMPLPAYSQWLIDTACQRPVGPQPPHPEIRDPANFLTALLRIIALSGEPITRLGLERAMDTVFALPALTPLLDNAVEHQNRFAAQHLPACAPRFHPFWQHIIRPAWDQHADIRRVCLETA